MQFYPASGVTGFLTVPPIVPTISDYAALEQGVASGFNRRVGAHKNSPALPRRASLGKL